MISEESSWEDEENIFNCPPPSPDYLAKICDMESQEYWPVFSELGGEGGNKKRVIGKWYAMEFGITSPYYGIRYSSVEGIHWNC